MWRKCRKEDGRYVLFNLNTISESIKKAATAVEKNDLDMDSILDEVLGLLPEEVEHKIPTTNEIGLAVEKALMHMGHDDIARAFILYRDNRRAIREGNSSMMKAVAKIIDEAQKDNANTPPSFPSKVLQIAEAALSQHNLTKVMDEDISEAHRNGAIHIHDLFGYGLAPNCLSIPLQRMLQEGFNTGSGRIRPPKRPASILALAAIILQANQNEMVGGQMYAHFDNDISAVFESNCKTTPSPEDVYQAIEGFVYNLNSMASLPYYEKIWVYDNKNKDLSLYNIGDFCENGFEIGRFKAISLNRENGNAELQDITNVYKHKNTHKIVRLHGNDGKEVVVTNNHSLMGMTPYDKKAFGEIKAQTAEQFLELNSYLTFDDFNYKEIPPRALTKFYGYYVAEGYPDGSAIGLSLWDSHLEADVKSLLSVICPNASVIGKGDTTKRGTISNRPNLRCNVGKEFVEKTIKECGHGAINKRIPNYVFFSSKDDILTFLDGYISGDGTVSKNGRISMSTISYELACGLVLLFGKLGIKTSIKRVPAGKRHGFENAKEIFGVSLTTEDSKKIKLTHLEKQKRLDTVEKTFSYGHRSKSFHYPTLKNALMKMFKLEFSPCYYYHVSESDLDLAISEINRRINLQEEYNNLLLKLLAYKQVFPVDIKNKQPQPYEQYVYDISVKDNENFLTAEGIFVHNSRFGGQKPFSTIVLGSDTTEMGREVTKRVFQVMQEGMDGSTFIWPNVIYRLQDGINLRPKDPNYDLTKLAFKTASLRMNPTFMFIDTPYNKKFGDEATYMGCLEKDEVVCYKKGNSVQIESIGRFCKRFSDTPGLSEISPDEGYTIYDANKGFIPLKGVLTNSPTNNWLRITFRNGHISRSLDVTNDHRFFVLEQGEKYADELEIGDSVQGINGFNGFKHNRKHVSEERIQKAYLYGLLLADGHWNVKYQDGGTVSCSLGGNPYLEEVYIKYMKNVWDKDVKKYVLTRNEDCQYSVLDTQAKSHKKGNPNLSKHLTKMFEGRLNDETHVPRKILNWSIPEKRAFLAGFVDGDGYIRLKETSKGQRISISIHIANKEVALQLLYLIQSLEMPASFRHGVDERKFGVEFYPTKEFCEYIKKQELPDNVYIPTHYSSDIFQVTSIEKLDKTQESYCVVTESEYFVASGMQVGNCRTRVIANIHGPEVIDGRGNICFTSINLPRIAFEAKGNVDKAFQILEKRLDLVARQLIHRLVLTGERPKTDFPFLFGENLYIDSEKLKDTDSILPSLKHGSLTFGFVGLDDFVRILTGYGMHENPDAYKLGYDVVEFIKKFSDDCIEKYKYNFAVIGSPAESASGRFAMIDKQLFGEHLNINDKGFYTNSHHMAVDADISVTEKLEKEGPFHKLCNGGHICHVFLDAAPNHNTKAIKQIVENALVNEVGYLAINYPINECKDCGNVDPISDKKCAKCGSKNLRKVRRITGYLAPLETWGNGKLKELANRRDK